MSSGDPSETQFKRETTLRDVYDEKFIGIGEKFHDRDRRVEMALAVQKEALHKQDIAIDKMERSVTKQLDAIIMQLDAVDDRLTSVEGNAKGQGSMWAAVAGGVTILISLVVAGIALSKLGNGP